MNYLKEKKAIKRLISDNPKITLAEIATNLGVDKVIALSRLYQWHKYLGEFGIENETIISGKILPEDYILPFEANQIFTRNIDFETYYIPIIQKRARWLFFKYQPDEEKTQASIQARQNENFLLKEIQKRIQLKSHTVTLIPTLIVNYSYNDMSYDDMSISHWQNIIAGSCHSSDPYPERITLQSMLNKPLKSSNLSQNLAPFSISTFLGTVLQLPHPE